MRSGEFVQGKFQAWARRKGIALQGSEGERGAKNYTRSLERQPVRRRASARGQSGL